MRKKSFRMFTIVASCVLVLVVCVSLYQVIHLAEKAYYATASEDRSHIGLAEKPTITLDGKTYTYNSDIRTLVFLGIDKEGALHESEDYQAGGQSDVILLVSYNMKEKEFFVVPVNRDTMTQVMSYGMFGDELGSSEQQITLAYAYGNGGRSSGENTLASLKGLLNQIPFMGFVASPMDTVAIVNDAVGGITVKIEDDFSRDDPSLVMGETIKLSGAQATHYVRGRMSVSDGTNLNRMKRQETFYKLLLEKLQQKKADELVAIFNEVNSYTMANIGSSELTSLLSNLAGYTFTGIHKIEGTAVQGEEYMEFRPDEAKLKQLLVDCYFTENK